MTMISKSKEKNTILGYYLTNPEARHYINEVAEMFGMYPANVNKRLKELEKDGILKSEFVGKERYFFLNKQFPLLGPYKEIFQKTIGIEQILLEIFLQKKQSKEVYIFGSYARNTMDAESDIDILVIGDFPILELEKIAMTLRKRFGREFNFISMSEKEFKNKKVKKNPFIQQIFSDKIIKIK